MSKNTLQEKEKLISKSKIEKLWTNSKINVNELIKEEGIDNFHLHPDIEKLWDTIDNDIDEENMIDYIENIINNYNSSNSNSNSNTKSKYDFAITHNIPEKSFMKNALSQFNFNICPTIKIKLQIFNDFDLVYSAYFEFNCQHNYHEVILNDTISIKNEKNNLSIEEYKMCIDDLNNYMDNYDDSTCIDNYWHFVYEYLSEKLN